MQIKKNPEADINRYRGLFYLVGLAVSLSLVIGLINYNKYDRNQAANSSYVYEEDEFEVEQTVQEKEPPPPPPAPPVLELVEDEVKTEDEPKIKSTEDDQKKAIKPRKIKQSISNTNEVYESWDVSQKAEFKGGRKEMDKWLHDNTKYPTMAYEEEIEGRVMVEFVVEKNGSISGVKIIGSRRYGFGLEREAERVVKAMSGMWNPAMQRDKQVRMKFRIPIRFELN